MRIALIIILMMFSSLSFADTYLALVVPASTTYTGNYSCSGNSSLSVAQCVLAGYKAANGCAGASSGWCVTAAIGNLKDSVSYWVVNSGGVISTVGFATVNVPQSTTCPAGGTLSGNDCINAPACISPQIRNLTTRLCFTPSVCDYPETDNGNGVCQNNTCPEGQTRNPTTSLCQVAPVCGSTETYDIYSNTCKLYPLSCPKNSHPNKANDACLDNPPLVCPLGQHDDGTYNCIADAAVACKSNQQYGKINGNPVCINKTNAEQAKNDADTAKANATIAKAAMDAAKIALDADPTNVTKQATYTASQVDYAAKKEISDTAQNNRDSDTLTSIDQTLKGDGPNVPSPTDLLTQLESGSSTNLSRSGEDFLPQLVQLPDSSSCQVVPMNYKGLSYTFDPCGRLQTFREMFGYMLYVLTAYGIYQIALKPGA